MQKTEIVDSIQSILTNELNLPHTKNIQPHSRLNEDLYLDSVLILQLLISLELKLGIDIPDEALSLKDFDTVDSFSDFILGRIDYKTRENTSRNNTKPQDKPGVKIVQAEQTEEQAEEFEDIKVHCFVSCLCECIKANDRVDHRPFYFGVWDAEVVIDNDYCINYHAENLNHNFFRHWFKEIYAVEVRSWYNPKLCKGDNINTLLTLLDNKLTNQHIMVMLDMYRLPDRENKFNQNPFPHYVMLKNSQDPEMLFMWDPDFRWEGEQNRKQVLHAIESDAVAGGYIFDSEQIEASSNQSISDYFIACLNLENNPMTDAVRKIIETHLTPESQLCPSNLSRALTQLPVLAIRKYAYEHGLAFFMLQLNLDFDEFETWCEIIEELVSTYKQIQFRSMKIANCITEGNYSSELVAGIKTEIIQLLDQQDQREFKIKHQLYRLHQQWQTHTAITEKEPSFERCI
ncbi:DUF6005 family protein [Microbulbifer sp. ZKSA006]|uniref:DUF6005 family protein n=1 Tax=Microbulbifer sp. ZKSA006 TaxID=3243390 RepID=UPI004039BBBC